MEKSSRTCLICDDYLALDNDSNACAPCAKKLERPAFLFCNKCLELWGVVDPGPMKYGQELKPGEKYHTNGCPGCATNGVDEFTIAELEGLEKSFN